MKVHLLHNNLYYALLEEKAMAPHSSTLAWKIPWTEEPGRLQSMGSLELDTTQRLHFHFSLSCIGEGNGNPLQCSCLETPRDGRASWAAIYGVAQCRPRLKRLSSSSRHCWMWELDCEESWVPKNWCFWTVVLEKTLQSPLDCKEIQPVYSEGDQSWDFFGGNDAKAGTPVLWPPHAKCWLIGKDSDAGRNWGQEEKGMTEDEMAGWHHWLDGPESEWTQGVSAGQGGLACCMRFMGSQRVRHDWVTELNWTEGIVYKGYIFYTSIYIIEQNIYAYICKISFILYPSCADKL